MGPEVYRGALSRAGSRSPAKRNQREFALEFFRNVQARIAPEGPAPLGIHILMGAEAPVKLRT